MTKTFPSPAIAACAALVLAIGIDAAAAQDFLSPKPMVQSAPSQARQRAPARAPAPASPSQAAAGAAAVKPDLSQEIGDWRLQCFGKPDRVCQLSQRRVNPNNQAMLIWVELTHSVTPRSAWQIAVMVPLGFKTAPDLGIQAGGELLLNVPVVTCVPAGCVYAAEMPLAALETLQKSSTLGTVIVDLKGKGYALNVSMRGFNEAYLKSALVLKEK